MREWLQTRNGFEFALFMAALYFLFGVIAGWLLNVDSNWTKEAIHSLIYGLLMSGGISFVWNYG